MFIYAITHLESGRRYVGKTTTSLSKRWRDHRSSARCGSPFYIHQAIAKYGEEAFSIEPIASFQDPDLLSNAEALFIAELGTQRPGGFNLTPGGDGAPVGNTFAKGHRRSAEAKSRMSCAARRRGNNGGGNFKPHSDEAKRKISESVSKSLKQWWATRKAGTVQ